MKDSIIQVSDFIDALCQGNFTKIPPALPEDETGILSRSLDALKQKIKFIVDETQTVLKAAESGRHTIRVPTESLEGGWKDFASDMNQFMDKFVNPIHKTSEYFDLLAKGDIAGCIAETCGEKVSWIKDNLNRCTSSINGLINEISKITESAMEGKLDVRGDPEKFQGEYAKIILGVNATIDAIVTPLRTAADYIDWIAMGVIPEKISQEYNGDFNEIKHNLNKCIDEMNGLLEEIHMLTRCASEGNLEMRGNSDRFSGDYSNIIKGINQTLDAVIHPLRSAADYIDWIAMGVIPEKITENFHGSFDEIKNNINRCIDAINGLLSEIHRLTVCASEGKLDSRGDTDKFSGEYSNIIKGINQLIDGFSNAVKTATTISMEMELAKKIQTVLLPRKPVISGYEIVASMAPADEVGGDYYDVISTAGYDWIVIGDVSGHGVPAGLVMMMVQTSIHTVLLQNPNLPPSELLAAVNRTIYENIQKMEEPKHMTIIVLAAGKDGIFSFSGLHEDILIWRAGASDVEKIETDGMWIGIQKDISSLLGTDMLTLNRGDCMILFTDGVIEAMKDGVMFGEERLINLIRQSGKESAAKLHADIVDALKPYQKSDDVTLFIIKRL